MSPWRQHQPFLERPPVSAIAARPGQNHPHACLWLWLVFLTWYPILSRLWPNGISYFHFPFQKKTNANLSGSQECLPSPLREGLSLSVGSLDAILMSVGKLLSLELDIRETGVV